MKKYFDVDNVCLYQGLRLWMALILSRYEIGSSESKFRSRERFEIDGKREREREIPEIQNVDRYTNTIPSILILHQK